MAYDDKRYRKGRSKKFLKEIQNGPWECILLKTDDKQKMEDSCTLLEHFEGCFVKVDGIICELKKVETPPVWSCMLLDDGGMQWFGLGSYFNIWLPLKQ